MLQKFGDGVGQGDEGAGTEREGRRRVGGRVGGANPASVVPAPPFATNPPPRSPQGGAGVGEERIRSEAQRSEVRKLNVGAAVQCVPKDRGCRYPASAKKHRLLAKARASPVPAPPHKGAPGDGIRLRPGIRRAARRSFPRNRPARLKKAVASVPPAHPSKPRAIPPLS